MWSKHQPKDGDVVLLCKHGITPDPDVVGKTTFQFFCVKDKDSGELEEVEFVRPDGSKGKAKWMVVCDRCYVRYHEDPIPAIAGEGTWKGDEPIVKDMRN